MLIRECVKKLREEANLSINSLAEVSSISASHISRIESGYRQPTPETLRKFSNVFPIKYIDLLIIAGIVKKEEIIEYK